jgi:hypothetical protein
MFFLEILVSSIQPFEMDFSDSQGQKAWQDFGGNQKN